ncbi:MAG: hypothetical protein FJ265_01395 [Planctomycetes bacterium]|nr:hypothetical protein [Planctomycetota bacterium]
MPNPARSVHPAIADPASGAFRQGPAPKFAYIDGQWNHGEGFAQGTGDPDYGGWFFHDDGRNVTSADVHLTVSSWQDYVYRNEVHLQANNRLVDRLQGYLRPAGLALPREHPRYGALSFDYVDTGAFEIFRPQGVPYANQKVLIVIQCWGSSVFPRVYVGQDPNNTARAMFVDSLYWWNTYFGYFSPDGLVRGEFGSTDPTTIGSSAAPGTPLAKTLFQQNTADDKVLRDQPHAVATWSNTPYQTLYYPISAYPVLSVMHRQTELNEQRYLQLAQAIKCLLQESTFRNPLGAANALTAQQVEDRVVVVFAGGSNGGLQASFATLRHPEIVHGCYAQVISSGMQRLYGDQDLGWAYSELSVATTPGAMVGPGDFLDWNHYAWGQGREIYDLSVLRRFFRGETYRPTCFYVSDEDITSTGTDWVRVANGGSGASGTWVPYGERQSTSTFGNPSYNTLAWLVGDKAGHGYGWAKNPYNQQPTLLLDDIVHDVAYRAVNQRIWQGSTPVPGPGPKLGSGVDEPHEWFFGRATPVPLPAPQPNDPLVRDDSFMATSQPGNAGTHLGSEEAMLVRDGRVYVGSAEGLVTSFVVDDLDPRRPLVVSRPSGLQGAQSVQLGSRAFALAALPQGGSWSLLVGTRRHLYKLDPVSLAVQQQVSLPWEVAQPRGMKVGDVLPGHGGPEVVFRTVHGGLVFYGVNLTPLFEWPEPGIDDFVLQGPIVTIQSSRRGVLANVVFDSNNHASLTAASKPLQTGPYDPPCQGTPCDLELMLLNLGGYVYPGVVTLTHQDTDGVAVRAYTPDQLLRFPLQTTDNLGGYPIDIATCREGYPPQQQGDQIIGEHLLVLTHDRLRLFNQGGQPLAEMNITESWSQANDDRYYPFTYQPCAIAVGDLVDNPGGTYPDEVVIATAAGHLVWLHVDEVLACASTNGKLPPACEVVLASKGGVRTDVQPRTNQALSATWPIAAFENVPEQADELHLCDQSGAYWKVGPSGTLQMWDCDGRAVGLRGWAQYGTVSRFGYGFPSEYAQAFNFPSNATLRAWVTPPWCPVREYLAVYQDININPFNWYPGQSLFGTYHGMFMFRYGGCLLGSGAKTEAWFWSDNTGRSPRLPGSNTTLEMGPWANHVTGLRIEDATGVIDGVWESTGSPGTTNSAGLGSGTPYHNLRNNSNEVSSITHQGCVAVKVGESNHQETLVVLGCPGGRVRVIEPGSNSWSTGGLNIHQLGTVYSASQDLGFGGAALAARADTANPNQVTIWFGTLYDPVAHPQQYSTPYGILGNSELAVGAVHKYTYTKGGAFSSPQTFPLAPSATHPRGAYGVVGMLLTNLLPQSPVDVDELIVATMSGDLIVFNADTMQEIWRTHVWGSIGFYNSMVAADLDNDNKKELYVAGSRGVWRFVRP